MSDGPSFNFENNLSGNGNNIAQGNNVTQEITQNFGAPTSEDFFQKLLDTLMDAAEEKGVQLDEEEATSVVNEMNEMATKTEAPEPAALETLKEKWLRIVSKAGPIVAKIVLAGVEQSPVAGPVFAMVKAGLQMYADSNPQQ